MDDDHEDDGYPRIERRSAPVDPELIDAIYDKINSVSISLKPEGKRDLAYLRDVYADVRDHDNMLLRVLGRLSPRVGQVRVDAERVRRVVEANSSHILGTGEGLLGASTEGRRKARCKMLLKEQLDQRSEIEIDLRLLEELVAHVRSVREAMRLAYEQASRTQSSLEAEYKINRSDA